MEKKQRKKVKNPMSETESNDLDDISCLFFQKGIMGLFLLISIFSLLLRVAVSLHSYSGAGTPPKFGDFEAQRHWMEITTNLPIKDWYFNTTNNDLSYWGLDYPPLTAYQSYFHGLFLKHFDPNSVSLFTSRGYETHFGKLLMRWTVLSSDLLIFFPAVLYFVLVYYGGNRSGGNKSDVAWHIAVILINPCLILTDHGHFQYNCISLGLTLGAVAAVLSQKDLLACVLFCLSLNHKQVLSRLAPFERGIYEDYVANFWCCTSVLIKWKRLFTTNSLRFLSLVATILTFLPSMIQQIWSPSSKGFLYGLLNSSLAFYLFSFQVHEKSILLPLLPATLLAMELPGVLSMLLMHSALLSMFPLLCRDKMAVPYMALYMLSILLYLAPCGKQHIKRHLSRSMITFSIVISYLCSLVLHIIYLTIRPPEKYPFLFEAMIMNFCFSHFLAFTVYTNAKQWMLSRQSTSRDKEKKLN
ncbi:probable dolichyl pyrophosphate Man9GlcNAc2 alpha-1,3-glucosyltransferase isoform X3 [Populus trichocarpa]|uniref:probable dolichyl pyrophosphate Man9GlcNAc2 alpha-1,3-glucosyltransferase isoform X3 n=1 Tax=Populus trichocarpa TaxID=3694 RepID=UPI000D189191|nr:probable dolichyl pyrophosphate Man9GlcNAc2 alpha-1,3-glucosyltransferase isoform X3 [Populus trichocarpa]|eukprot:XP_024444165.1 probable dolichyl pyrophosphate Man9GlcNAc2 alpha-1,3-glucosyltransferase isoform X3 [Populus trichocarpa]